MTAPTPELSDLARSIKSLERTAKATLTRFGSRLPSDARIVLDALAAVTADLNASIQMHKQARSLLDQTLTELDQAREALAADNKLGAFETGKTIGAAEVRKELDQARQMLADAPHAEDCPMWLPDTIRIPEDKCFCWKAGL
jgi:exonuclease VII small subunit